MQSLTAWPDSSLALDVRVPSLVACLRCTLNGTLSTVDVNSGFKKPSPLLSLPRVLFFRTVCGNLCFTECLFSICWSYFVFEISRVGVNYIIKISTVNFLHPCGVIIFFRLRASAVFMHSFVLYFALPWAGVSFLGVKATVASFCASANL